MNRSFFQQLIQGSRSIGVPMLAYHHTAAAEPLIAAPQSTSPEQSPMNLKAIINAASIAFALLPIITSFIQQAESLLVNATGSEKMKAVAASTDVYLTKINADAETITAVKNQLEPMVSAMVSMFNIAGLFSHKAATVADTAPQA